MSKKARINGLQATHAAIEESKRGPIRLEPATSKWSQLDQAHRHPWSARERRHAFGSPSRALIGTSRRREWTWRAFAKGCERHLEIRRQTNSCRS
jgi:hypothetical protein